MHLLVEIHNTSQAGLDPPEQNHASYEVSALPQSHHGWIETLVIPETKVSRAYFSLYNITHETSNLYAPIHLDVV